MIYTGMMTGEMRRLEASMVDLEKQAIVGVGLKTEERRNKSVLIPDAIVPLLQDLISQHPEGRFYTMGEEDFYALYYQALTEAGVTRHLTPYSCRHTTATALAVNAGVAPQTVQRIMRWTSTKMMDRYVHPSDDNAWEALNQMGAGSAGSRLNRTVKTKFPDTPGHNFRTRLVNIIGQSCPEEY